MMLTLAQAEQLVPGALRVGDGNVTVQRVHTDTRSLQSGDLFVALQGERFDAHDFLPQALAAGAVAAIASHGLDAAGLPGLQVEDTLAALQALAQGWRRRHPVPLIAVAGSNGKTTVTQMIASILRAAHGDAALATAGNLNNHIGVPLTLLRLRSGEKGHVIAVVELGMNHPGEIAELAALAQPTVALVNNAQREHQEFMHSVEAVAKENGAAISALSPKGCAVFPADDVYAPLWQAMAGDRKVLRFALQGDADVTLAAAAWQADGWHAQLNTPAGSMQLQLRVAGRHNLKNALAATAAALAAGISLNAIAKGLQAFEPVRGRSAVRHLQRDGAAQTLIDDSYNANPDSVRAAIDLLAELPAPRWLVLGDMGEVGEQGPQFHEEAGALARARGIEALWCAGSLSTHAAKAYGTTAQHYGDTVLLIDALQAKGAPPFASVLVKGSRFMGMERVVAALTAEGAV